MTGTVRAGISVTGIIVPAIVFVGAFLATYLLYRHFARK
jgi:hypothetical protein